MVEGAIEAPGRLSSAVRWRWLSLSLLLAVEIVGITTRFDTASLEDRPGFLALALGYAPTLLNVALAFSGVFLLAVAPRLPARIERLGLKSHRHPWMAWLGLHLVSFTCFFLLSATLFGEGDGSTGVSLQLTVGWLALALSTGLVWLLAVAPAQAWWELIADERRALLASALAALGAWLAGQATQILWEPLANATFWIARGALGFVYADVVVDAGKRILGTPAFEVEIAPSCSGYEGIGLIIAFVGVYLWIFRKDLRFPKALVLLPLSAVIIWLFNAARITALIAVGSSWSPRIAAGGFHSQAGWISFITVALLVVGVTHHMRLFAHRQGSAHVPASQHGRLAAALLMPFVVLMGSTIVASAASAGFDALYPFKMLVTAGAIWFFRGVYRQLQWHWSWHSVAIGIAVFILWVLLERTPDRAPTLPSDLAVLPAWLAVGWLAFRAIGSAVVVPLAEELAFRGYLLRKLAARKFEDVDPRRFSLFAFLGSSLLFGVLHGRWLAGTLAGMAYALAVYRKGRIGDAVVAHGITNALIAGDVLVFGQWSLWV